MFTGGVPQDPPTADVSFTDLGLSAPIVQSLTAIGFAHPTPIQHRVIPEALRGVEAGDRGVLSLERARWMR